MWKNLQLRALQALRSFEYSTRIPVTSMLTDTGLTCVHDVSWYQSTWQQHWTSPEHMQYASDAGLC